MAGSFVTTLKATRHAIRNRVNEVRGLRPRIPVSRRALRYRTLGSGDCAWTFVESEALRGCTVLSCGAGEDISFDIEFAARYEATVIIVDPTPRAVKHVRAVQATIAGEAGTPELPPLYDQKTVAALRPGQIVLDARALWNEVGTVRFFSPADPAHVSHSIVDFQHGYRRDGHHIEVPATTYGSLAAEWGLTRLPLLKLDIEGAETEVLTSLRAADLLPNQICVEYDELLKPGANSAKRVRRAHEHLSDLGYTALWKDRAGANFLYVRDDAES